MSFAIGADPRLPSRMVVVDAGARGGFTLLPGLRSRLEVHAFEPDADACARLTADGLLSLRAWPVALGARRERRALHVTRHPSMSSLLAPDPDAYARHFGRMADYPAWARGIEVVRTEEVETVALDEWAEGAGVDRVHFLKLDTQGTEAEVLQGARRLLAARRVLVVHTEVCFLPIYRQQALFPDLDRQLTESGFQLVDCRFYPQPDRGRWSGGYAEPPRWAAVGDATYAARPEGWPAEERAGHAIAVAALLAQLGYGRAAAGWLRRGAHWPEDEVAATLDAWTRRSFFARARARARYWTPPALRRG